MSIQRWNDYLAKGKFTFGNAKRGVVYVYFKSGIFSRHQLGWLWKQAWNKEAPFAATILMPDHELSRDLNPREFKAWEEERQVNLGNFPSRKEAAQALLEASLDRGLLAELKADYLGPLGMLAEAAE